MGVAHNFQVTAPVLGDAFQPSIDIEGGWIEEKAPNGLFLIPNEPVVRVEVLKTDVDGEVLLDTFRFVCQRPPLPHMSLLVNGNPYTGLTTIPKRSRLIFQVLPDATFEANFPKDAQYGLDNVEVLVLVKPDAPPRSILKFSGKGRSGSQGVAVLLDEAPIRLRAGTVIYIRAEGVFRRTAQGTFEYEDRFTERERTITVVLR